MTTPAHIRSRIRRRELGQRMARPWSGTPGFVVWCVEHSYPPTTSLEQAEAELAQALANGCRQHHAIRPVLISSDGTRYRFTDREDEEDIST